MMIIWSFSTSILLTTVRWDQPDCLDTVCEFPHQYHKPIFSFPFKPHTKVFVKRALLLFIFHSERKVPLSIKDANSVNRKIEAKIESSTSA